MVEVSILTCEIIDGRSWSSDATIPASVIPRCFVNERVGDISAPDTSSEPLISVEGLTKIRAVIPDILSNFRRVPTPPLVRHDHHASSDNRDQRVDTGHRWLLPFVRQ